MKKQFYSKKCIKFDSNSVYYLLSIYINIKIVYFQTTEMDHWVTQKVRKITKCYLTQKIGFAVPMISNSVDWKYLSIVFFFYFKSIFDNTRFT